MIKSRWYDTQEAGVPERSVPVMGKLVYEDGFTTMIPVIYFDDDKDGVDTPGWYLWVNGYWQRIDPEKAQIVEWSPDPDQNMVGILNLVRYREDKHRRQSLQLIKGGRR